MNIAICDDNNDYINTFTDIMKLFTKFQFMI